MRDAVDERLPHRRRVYPYCGFELVYSKGTSLVWRIETYGDYEPEVIGALVAELGRSRERTFVDVGANIGLISLAALAGVPGSRGFAFEPGPHQRALLADTIRRNGLKDRLTLSPLALSDAAGTACFAVHRRRHAAGDGLVDTGRAGPARSITVETETLDAWWQRSGRPWIDVVKIDTEGAELLVLRGAGAVIAECGPTIFLEISEDNLRAYPHGAADVRAHLEGLRYTLEPVGPGDFAARPE